ncbi:threonine/homoserine efflux transporter RhtA [Paracandidimonas soli]|uniref:Threonine/homoserine efflux transporter RhtA n=1 Tax=Paracandidimonas soli TaxID=1917182 RepID=A0A4R3UVP7_9BURK|nr:threonine/homoserine efflux transporter RhtA [Paracandidimonas soli]
MIDERKPLDVLAVSAMMVLCLIWSLQQILLKATGAYMAPMLQLGVRSGVAAVLVMLLVLVRTRRLAFSPGAWKPGLLAGLLFAGEFLLVGESLRFTSAAHMVVFLYTAPVFAALGLHLLLPSERLALGQWLGIGLAVSGIAVTFLGPGAQTGDMKAMLLGDLLALGAGALWGLTTVVIRSTRLSAIPPSEALLYQLGSAFVLLVVAAFWLGQTQVQWTGALALSLLFQSVVVAFLSFLIWFWLLQRYQASRLGVFSFATPVFGVLLGAWLLSEAIEPRFLMGAALVLAGVILVSAYGWLCQLLRRRP